MRPVASDRRFHRKVHHEQQSAGEEGLTDRREESSELVGRRTHVRIVERPRDELADDRNRPRRIAPSQSPRPARRLARETRSAQTSRTSVASTVTALSTWAPRLAAFSSMRVGRVHGPMI